MRGWNSRRRAEGKASAWVWMIGGLILAGVAAAVWGLTRPATTVCNGQITVLTDAVIASDRPAECLAYAKVINHYGDEILKVYEV